MTQQKPEINLDEWMKERRITEVECLIPDISGVARGKILPTNRFLKSRTKHGLRISESIFAQTVTGEYPDEAWEKELMDATSGDVAMIPDPNSVRMVPWYQEPTAQVVMDCAYLDGEPLDISARHILRRVLKMYEDKGWQPVVAPEIEFYLCQTNVDPDQHLEPPVGRSGRQERGKQAFGIDAVNEFDPIFEDVYDYCDAMELDVETLIHEGGMGQVEINFDHGDPLDLADQMFIFKRTMRQAAYKHNIHATFMAKPMGNQPGSSMHLHQSIVDKESGKNLFADKDGNDSDLFRSFIAGQQQFIREGLLILAPNVNSYRRLVPDSDAPINLHWGVDNRTVGLRVPISDANGRRLENRFAGADVNPYLSIAVSLACGFKGMMDKLQPTEPCQIDAYTLKQDLPRHLYDSIDAMQKSDVMKELLGERFVDVLCAVKRHEAAEYRRVVSAWEREHLLLNV